jgi:CBS domain-containing protein
MLLPIRIRTIHAADGSATAERSVPCRSRSRPASVEECFACPARIGAKLDPRGESWIACRRGASDDEDDYEASVGAAVAQPVHCVRADLGPERLRELLERLDLDAVAVVDAHDRLVGVATAGDLVPHPVISVGDDEPIGRAAAIMAYERVEHLAVVSEGGDVLGVITPRDLLRWIAQKDGYIL